MRVITTLTLVAATIGTLSAPLLARADNDELQCTSADQSTWLTEKAVTDSLLAQGFSEVRRIKVSAGQCYEAYVVASNGEKKELYLDPVTGKVVAED